MKKEKYKRETTFEKTKQVSYGSPGSWVDRPDRLGFVNFLHWPVFYFTRTDLVTGSTRQVSPNLITILLGLHDYDMLLASQALVWTLLCPFLLLLLLAFLNFFLSKSLLLSSNMILNIIINLYLNFNIFFNYYVSNKNNKNTNNKLFIQIVFFILKFPNKFWTWFYYIYDSFNFQSHKKNT